MGFPKAELNAQQVAALLAGGPAVRANVFATLGDSISAQGTANTASNHYYYAYGYMSWTKFLSRNNIYFPLSNNLGVNGDTTTLVLARLSAAIVTMQANNTKFCVVHIGTNDIVAGSATPATVQTNLQSIYEQIGAAGITVIAVPILPRSNDGAAGLLSVSLRRKIYKVNQWIIRYCAQTKDGIVLADPTKYIVDYSATTTSIGNPIGGNTVAATSYMQDGLHPAHLGAYWMGYAINAAVSPLLLATRSTLFENPIDTYHATDNTQGNLLSNGAFVGTGGALAGGATGALGVADSLTLQKTAGAGTVVGSKTTRAVGNGTTYNTQTITLTGAVTGKLYEQVYSDARFAVNDTIYAEVEVYVSTASKMLELFIQTDAGTMSGRDLHPVSTQYYPDGSWSGVLRTPDITVTDISAITWFVQATTDTGGTAVVEFGKASWRKTV